MLDKLYVVMDDTMYSSQFTLVALFLRLSLKFTDEKFDKSSCTEEELIYIRDIIDTSLSILKSGDDTVFNKIITRDNEQYISISQELLEWVLDQVNDLDELDCRVSGLTNLFTSNDAIFVYNPENLIENLIIRKLGIIGKTKNPFKTWNEFLIDVENAEKECSDKNKRFSILTANTSLVNTLASKFPIMVPDNYKFINRQQAFGKIVCWALENKEQLKEEKENE